MRSRTTRGFRAAIAKLPLAARRQARIAYGLFKLNPAHPSLHFKCVGSDPPIYSARVGIGYRALGVREGDTLIWYWIGPHSEYDSLIGRR